uniref:Uncharacterized protein n=1 Tax=Rhipicephalus microplus TaxID=6941 RepID=A0A6G5A246_RHIMP
MTSKTANYPLCAALNFLALRVLRSVDYQSADFSDHAENLVQVCFQSSERDVLTKIAGAEDDANYYAYQGHQADTHDDGQDHFPGFRLTAKSLLLYLNKCY